MTNEITELEKAASLLRLVANDLTASAKDRTVCISASRILTNISIKLRQIAPLPQPAVSFAGPKIVKIIRDQEVH